MRKDNKAQMGMTTILIAIFGMILLIIGVAIISDLFNAASNTVSATQVLGDLADDGANQAFTLTPVGNRLVTTTLVVGNTSVVLTSGNYTITEAGSLVVNTTHEANSSSATWDYEPVGFIETGTTRTVVSFIVVFFALAALAFVAFTFTNRS